MAALIVKIQREHYPEMRFIGRCYTDKDRQNGSFSGKWGEWFANGLFKPLEAIQTPLMGDAYIGAMRMADGQFQYWIGMFFAADTPVPDGYQYADIQPTDYAVCWLYGNEQNGELYGMENHNNCLKEMKTRGWEWDKGWCFERYNCPRFTVPDEKGNVILDYGIAIKKCGAE